MLWLALVFPRLPLEAQRGTASAAGACVVQRGRVLVVDEVAAAAGLASGMRLSTARGILPEARIIDRDADLLAREARALDELACYAGGVSPTVSIEAPHTLLLEIGGCLRLFGGVQPIVTQLFAACDERGLTTVAGLAPTPRAAQWLALAQTGRRLDRAGPDRVAQALAACCLSLEALPDTLVDLPLDVLAVETDLRARLQSFGLRRLGEVIALPRAALAQRVGPLLVMQLQQALGERPDPRAGFCFPEHFRQVIELPGVVDNAAMLAFPARRLIGDLCGWLAARQSGASACTLMLHAERRGVAPLPVRLGLSGPSRDPLRFERLLREKLAQVVLAAPVGEIALEAGRGKDSGADSGEVVALPGVVAGLFEKRRPQTAIEALVERLRARFDEAAVHGLITVPDHRPECATQNAAIGRVSPELSSRSVRPLWLLRQPEALSEAHGRPTWTGEALHLLGGPERIESGWWDEGESRSEAWGEAEGGTENPSRAGSAADAGRCGQTAIGDVRRDYFLARTGSGQYRWVYRDARGWWGQGLELPMPSVSDQPLPQSC